MGIFHVFKIVQMVPNRTKHHMKSFKTAIKSVEFRDVYSTLPNIADGDFWENSLGLKVVNCFH